FFAGIDFIRLGGFTKESELRAAAIDLLSRAHRLAERFVAFLEKWILRRDFAQAIRMRIDELELFAAAAFGLRLRRLHRIENRIEQIEGNDYENAGAGIGPLQLPRNGLRKLLDFGRARRGVETVRLDVLPVFDGLEREGIGVGAGDVRPFGGIGIGEDDACSDILRGADGFDEWVG